MAHIQKRRRSRQDGSSFWTWRARYIAPDGVERSQTFSRRVDAERFLATVEADKVRGTYVDPSAGKETVRTYAERWRQTARHEPSTAALYERLTRLHVYPVLGNRRIASVRHSDARAFVAGLGRALSANTARQVHALTRTIFRSAVLDKVIAESPFTQIRLPRVEVDRTVVPPTVDEVRALVDAAPEDLQTLLLLAALSGCRSGELLGLPLENVDFLRRELHVRQQLNYLPGGGIYLAEPKTPESVRTVPLPRLAVEALAEHLQRFPAEPVMLPRGDVDGPREPVRLLFQRRSNGPILRTTFAGRFRSTVRRAGLADRGLTPHSLRKHYASALSDAGLPERVIAAWLGHVPMSVTGRVYTLIDRTAAERTRAMLDGLWSYDGPRTAPDIAATL